MPGRVSEEVWLGGGLECDWLSKENLIRRNGGVNGSRERGESQSQKRLALSRERVPEHHSHFLGKLSPQVASAEKCFFRRMLSLVLLSSD